MDGRRNRSHRRQHAAHAAGASDGAVSPHRRRERRHAADRVQRQHQLHGVLMAFAPILPGDFNPEWDATLGRRGRKKHGHAPDFNPLALGNDLLLWFDPTTLTVGAITTWADRTAGKVVIPGGTGSPTYDGRR